MGILMDNNSAETARLLEQARAGDHTALNEVFARHRARLRFTHRVSCDSMPKRVGERSPALTLDRVNRLRSVVTSRVDVLVIQLRLFGAQVL